MHKIFTYIIRQYLEINPEEILTLCHSYLKPYCMGRKTAVFSAGI
jgi:hypothetical protein